MVLKKRTDGIITGDGAGHWDDMVDVLRRTRTVVFPFVAGGNAGGIVTGQFVHGAGVAQGWQVNLDAEWAIALGHIPDDYLTFVSLEIYGVTEKTEGDEMRLELEAYGAASDEIFSTETISVADKDSETTNMTQNDIVYWKFVLGDAANFGDLTAGDSLQIKVIHEAVGDGSIDTQAVFRYALLTYTIDA